MVAVKASAVPAFLRAPDPACRAVLVYGPDAGLVGERAGRMQQIFAGKGEESELVRLDERDLAENGGRLEIELRMVPMFASRKVVRVAAGARLDVAGLAAALDEAPENALVVEAGNLRPDSALRKLFEKAPFAAALPCYSDDRNTVALIDEELAAAGLSIDRDTRRYLLSRLGADQALSRAEVAKLALYAAGKGAVQPGDIDAIVGDSAEVAVETFVFLVSGGETAEALRQLSRIVATGISPHGLFVTLARHFTRLYQVAAARSQGQAMEAALRKVRPPLHFKRKDAFAAHAEQWGAGALLAAMPLIQEASLKARLSPDLEQAHLEQLVLALVPQKLSS